MTLDTALERIQSAAHDISGEYSRTDLIGFMNTCIQQAAALLISGNYPELVQQTTLTEGSTLPKNLMKACGNYPICVTGGTVSILDDDVTSVTYRYFGTPEAIPFTADDDYDLPFTNDAINEAIIRQATVLALNQNEYNITQDSTLNTAFQQAITAAMGSGA